MFLRECSSESRKSWHYLVLQSDSPCWILDLPCAPAGAGDCLWGTWAHDMPSPSSCLGRDACFFQGEEYQGAPHWTESLGRGEGPAGRLVGLWLPAGQMYQVRFIGEVFPDCYVQTSVHSAITSAVRWMKTRPVQP